MLKADENMYAKTIFSKISSLPYSGVRSKASNDWISDSILLYTCMVGSPSQAASFNVSI